MRVRTGSSLRPWFRASALLAALVVSAAPVDVPADRASEGAAVADRRPHATPGFFAPSRVSVPAQSDPCYPRPRNQRGHEYYFTRAIYSSGRGRGFFGGGRGGGSWSVDFPKADQQFLVVVKRLANLDAPDCENPVSLDDPELRRYPFLYMLEIGGMSLSEEEVEGLRGYLAAGGFLVVDDFWGEYAWSNLVQEMARVLPGRPIVDLPLDHALFKTYYNIDEILQVPSVNNAAYGQTSECGPCRPFVKAIFDDRNRLMVVINGNTDLGDAWEWAEQPFYPLEYSTFAYEMGVNMIVYSMSH